MLLQGYQAFPANSAYGNVCFLCALPRLLWHCLDLHSGKGKTLEDFQCPGDTYWTEVSVFRRSYKPGVLRFGMSSLLVQGLCCEQPGECTDGQACEAERASDGLQDTVVRNPPRGCDGQQC